MIPAPLPQPAPFTCSRCGAPLPQLPAKCEACGELVATPKRLRSSTALGRVASVFALLVWGAMAVAIAGAVVVGIRDSQGFHGMSFSPGEPMLLVALLAVALIVVGGLLASVSLFLRRPR